MQREDGWFCYKEITRRLRHVNERSYLKKIAFPQKDEYS